MNRKLAQALARKADSDRRIATIQAQATALIPDYGFVDSDLAKSLLTTDKAFHYRANCRPTFANQMDTGYEYL
jgi:hypothetical protein